MEQLYPYLRITQMCTGTGLKKFIDKLYPKKIVLGDSGCFRPDSSVNVDEFLK